MTIHQNSASIQSPRFDQCHVGIDVSKDTLDLCLLCNDNATPLHRQFTNCATGWQAIVDQVSAHPLACITLEATGGYERGIVRTLQGAGQPVAVFWVCVLSWR